MRTVYAIQLQVTLPEGKSPEECFDNLVHKVNQWVERKYERWGMEISATTDGTRLEPSQGHIVCGTKTTAADVDLFTLEWTHPHDSDPSTTWISNCIVARHGLLVQVAVVLRISTTREVLRPVRFDLGRPGIATDVLMSYDTAIDDWPVPSEVQCLASPQVESFVENVLLNTKRNLPVVMISPDVWNDTYLVKADELFERIRGFAHVALLKDKWTAFKLTDSVEKPLSCYGGAVRVYWPGFTLEANPFHHKLFLPQSIRYYSDQGVPLPDYLFRTLAAVASFRYTEGSIIRKVHQAIADLERKKVDELRKQVKTGSVEKEALETQLLEALERIDHLADECDRYRDDLAAQQAAWAEVQGAMAAGETTVAKDEPEEKVQFNSVLGAVQKAKKDFSGPLVFLDSAFESAQESPYKNPERVYELFEALALVASDWKEKAGALGRSWNDAMEEFGFDLRDQVSTTSKGKYGDEYTFMYKGQRRLFEKHITIGGKQADRCLSVHWYRDDEDLVLAIGHCGRHPSNTSK